MESIAYGGVLVSYFMENMPSRAAIFSVLRVGLSVFRPPFHAITQVNPEASKLVVSNRRAVLEQEMKELSRGDVVEG